MTAKKDTNKPVKKAAAKKTAAKKVAAKKTAVKKTSVKKTATKKVAVKKTAVKKTAVKKTAVKKTAVKKTAVKKTAVKKTATEKTVVKKVPKKRAKRRGRRDPLAGTPQPQDLNIVDAITIKAKKIVQKPGQVISMRDKSMPQENEPSLTMEEYKPPHRSILDKEENTGPVYRYSDEELNEFKELLLSRLEKAKADLAYFQGLITRKDDSGTSDTDNRHNHAEDGSAAMEREQISQLASRQASFIGHLENALIRIENKTYGICRVTGKLIDKDRLNAVPHATLSIEAKNEMNK